VILGINLAVFAWMLTQGAGWFTSGASPLVIFGLNHGPWVVAGEWWRLLTSCFLHVGAVHLAVNMYSLRAVGPLIERLYGSAAYVCIYLACGICASLCSVLWRPDGVSMGASGAIFALVGALLAFVSSNRRAMPRDAARAQIRNILFIIGLNLFFGFTQPRIDNAAHIGGLVSGCVCGWMLLPNAKRPPRLAARRLGRLGLFGLVLIALAALAVWRVERAPLIWWERGRAAFDAGEIDQALELAERGLWILPEHEGLLELRAEAELARPDPRSSLLVLEELLAAAPDDPILLRGHARLAVDAGQIARARADLDRLMHLQPDDFALGFERGLVAFAQEDWGRAHQDFELARHSDAALIDRDELEFYALLNQARAGGSAARLSSQAVGEVTELTSAFLKGTLAPLEFQKRLRVYADQHRQPFDPFVRATFVEGERALIAGDAMLGAQMLEHAFESAARVLGYYESNAWIAREHARRARAKLGGAK
jgi:rhomboid protease GluP